MDAREVLNQASDLQPLENVLGARTILGEAWYDIAGKKQAYNWAVNRKLAPVQRFLQHILLFSSMYYNDERVFKKCHNILTPL